jgi:hypothetical protein
MMFMRPTIVNAGLKLSKSAGRKIPGAKTLGLTKEPNAQPGGRYEHTRFEATGVESRRPCHRAGLFGLKNHFSGWGEICGYPRGDSGYGRRLAPN